MNNVNRRYQAILIGSVIVGSWLGMQAIHELGHLLGAWLTGGRVARVVLHPLTISRTDLAVNPRPLFVVWSGPILGIIGPLLLWGVVLALRVSWAFVLRFFAGFCLLANGLYIGVGSFDHIGDAGDMSRHGSPTWLLWLFGASAAPLGCWLWHRQGPYFGLGGSPQLVRRHVVFGCLAVCVMLVVLGLIVGDG